MRAAIAIILLGVGSAFAESPLDAEPTDLSNARQRAFRQHVDTFVTIRGRFNLHGPFGAMVSGKHGFVFIVSPFMKPSEWDRETYGLLENKRVAVTGTLQFHPSSPHTGDDSKARTPDYYYFELEHCRIEQLFGADHE